MIWGAHPYFWVDTHILQLVMKSRGLFIMSGQIYELIPKSESFGDFGDTSLTKWHFWEFPTGGNRSLKIVAQIIFQEWA